MTFPEIAYQWNVYCFRSARDHGMAAKVEMSTLPGKYTHKPNHKERRPTLCGLAVSLLGSLFGLSVTSERSGSTS